MADEVRLPHFAEPPVVAVRLSVSYDRLPKVRTAHAGVLWERLGGTDAFEDIDSLYPEHVVEETFGETPLQPGFDVRMFDRPPPVRTLLLSRDRSSTIELQDNQLTVSWTRQPQGTPYPRYEAVRERFVQVFEAWTTLIEELNLGALRPNQAEISYDNMLPTGAGWDDVADLREVLRFEWLPTPAALVDEVPEDLHVYQRYVLRRGGEPYGRLYLSADSARTHEERKALSLDLSVRGAPHDGAIDGTLSVLDVGHDIIVNTFVTVTTEQMHKLWGRS